MEEYWDLARIVNHVVDSIDAPFRTGDSQRQLATFAVERLAELARCGDSLEDVLGLGCQSSELVWYRREEIVSAKFRQRSSRPAEAAITLRSG